MLPHTQKTIFVTGGAGFIGSHVLRRFVNTYPQYHLVNIDKLSYAGNLENVQDIQDAPNYTFEKADITDFVAINNLFEQYQPDGVIHLAAESHVDRSILDPLTFVHTNVLGTVTLLEAAKRLWGEQNTDKRFYHVSTDEVYGSLGAEGFFTESTAYDPRSPYSASKASSDHFVLAYYHTYRLPVVLSNCSNNYGSHHFPEKLIPLMIQNILQQKPLPIYGKGENIRDWLWVEDHARAIDLIFHKGRTGEKYNIGGINEWRNKDLVLYLCRLMDKKLNRPENTSQGLITYVGDRKGHDLRYAIDATKLLQELGWQPSVSFEEGLERTVDWYLQNQDWVANVISGAYLSFYEQNYKHR